MPYPEFPENSWIMPVKRNFISGCCDCGLVHAMDFRIKEGRIQFRVRRDERRTGQQRRRRKIKIKEKK